jgi:hypothetical protein
LNWTKIWIEQKFELNKNLKRWHGVGVGIGSFDLLVILTSVDLSEGRFIVGQYIGGWFIVDLWYLIYRRSIYWGSMYCWSIYCGSSMYVEVAIIGLAPWYEVCTQECSRSLRRVLNLPSYEISHPAMKFHTQLICAF